MHVVETLREKVPNISCLLTEVSVSEHGMFRPIVLVSPLQRIADFPRILDREYLEVLLVGESSGQVEVHLVIKEAALEVCQRVAVTNIHINLDSGHVVLAFFFLSLN